MNFAGTSIIGVMVMGALSGFLWFFGIHGGNIIMSVTTPILMPLALENLAAYEAGKPLPYIITSDFGSGYTFVGIGSMLSLAILMCLFSKSEKMKNLGLLSIVPAIFFINDPLLFGLPAVLNVLFLIPLTCFRPLLALLTYLVMKAGIVNAPVGCQLPFTTPPIISGFLQGGVSLAVWQILMILLTCVMYWPFFKAWITKLWKRRMP